VVVALDPTGGQERLVGVEHRAEADVTDEAEEVAAA
jgi:hypothetical protein